MVTMQSWMFLSSFEKLRGTIMKNQTITTLMHMENMVLGIAFGTAVSVLKNEHIAGYKGTYNHIKLEDIEDGEPKDFPVKGNRFAQVSSDNFEKIPGAPVAYWVSEAYRKIYETDKKINDYATVFEGLKTRDNDRFLRLWYEVYGEKWKYYAKGGSFRKWYGNCEYVVDWSGNGETVRAFKKSSGGNFAYYFLPTITYSAITSYKFSGRHIENQIFGGGGGGITNTNYEMSILAFVNSSVFFYMLNAISPTLNFEVGQIGTQPLRKEKIEKTNASELAKNNIEISKEDWDSFETSWDFGRHPLI